ncbi:MAG: MFS transporter [Gammaproteobacteria bacterium]|nr:MFS transporter [Gammaproteobacteria bacterium]
MSSDSLSAPRALAGWFAVGVLLAAYAISFLDRLILTLIVQPLKADLGISDTEFGLLQGPAFALFYATMGLPLGWLADRVHRVRLMAFAILFWSLMTFLSGLATDYWHLLLCRFGVGFGEAALVPAAVSLLADLFPPQRRALPVSVFTAGLAVGSGLALYLGGSFIAFAEQGATGLPLIGPFFEGRAPWHIVLMLAGLVGLPVAALVLTLDEPRAAVRPGADTAGATAQAGGRENLAAAWRHLVAQRAFFLPMLASMGVLFVISTSMSAWLPQVFIRDHGWSPVIAGQTLGPVILFAALAGNFASGALATAQGKAGRDDAVLRTMFQGACVLVPAAIAIGLFASPQAALVTVGVAFLALGVTFGVASLAFVEVTPPRLRGQVVAIYLLIGNLVGLALGPTGVGALMDSGWAWVTGVGAALAATCFAAGLPGLYGLWRAWRRFTAAKASPAAR